jgi:hypothetical protein
MSKRGRKDSGGGSSQSETTSDSNGVTHPFGSDVGTSSQASRNVESDPVVFMTGDHIEDSSIMSGLKAAAIGGIDDAPDPDPLPYVYNALSDVISAGRCCVIEYGMGCKG